MDWLTEEKPKKKKESGIWKKFEAVLSASGWKAIRVENACVLGFPDVIAHRTHDGKTMYIELKSFSGDTPKYRPGQLSFLENANLLHVPSFVGTQRDGVLFLLNPKQTYSEIDFKNGLLPVVLQKIY